MTDSKYEVDEAPAKWLAAGQDQGGPGKGHSASLMNGAYYQACKNHTAYDPDRDAPGTAAATFGRLSPAGKAPADTQTYRAQLAELAGKMSGGGGGGGQANAGMTFLGQFIDHDLTLDTTTELGKRAADPVDEIINFRTPRLDLDCVYGDGPEGSPFLYDQPFDETGKLLFGRHACEGTGTVNDLDLPRNRQGRALIGDPRNDENLFVSQVHGRLFIAKHNMYVDQIAGGTGKEKYEAARERLTEEYHRMIVEDFLPSVVDAGALQPFLDWLNGGAAPEQGNVNWSKVPDMPVEFSAAAYRFGHSMVRQNYLLKAGRPAQIFNGALRGFSPVDVANNLDMALFFGPNAQSAEPIDTQLPDALLNLPPEVVGAGEMNLALRNMDRGQITFQLPTGEEMAAYMDQQVTPSDQNVIDAGLKDATPLWYYILSEAEKSGGKLGPVGGSIVAGVLVNLLRKGKSHVAKTLTS